MQQVFLILCNRPFLHDFSDQFVQQLSTLGNKMILVPAVVGCV